ncbi:NDUFA12-domain-containing protein [Suhomyces tanzawaensis NRRL Y-17324]|uniref:NADH dehydrogenase [ubiquinone] 1 alpha subcomplex subunit n=1 Tax=Suhomyces tanzawaensis NRRL Y-17324 TaxID=984487 RepID=A0A1E4SG41_9ASCO|nr:NDUFA12-domain-containing protein [Suhomyces tanzawaensis NRRL Y-17324]ODV78483.1 NDUFA12-domain-containing protein [Suhomyces tanzawaensis NRRL Y-17324]
MSTSIVRTIKNIYLSGLRRAGWQIQNLNDTKRGTLVGEDDFGNKFYETDVPEEIHLRTRWVEYNTWGMSVDMSQVEPGWHYWLGYGTNTRPNQLQGDEKATRAYPLPEKHKPNLTNSAGAYVPYNTARPKHTAWAPQVKERVEV